MSATQIAAKHSFQKYNAENQICNLDMQAIGTQNSMNSKGRTSQRVNPESITTINVRASLALMLNTL